MREVLDPVTRWSAEGLRVGMATLISVRRTAPRPPGARLAANERGDTAGSVSSGCVESDLLEHLLAVIGGAESRLLEYGITDEMAAGVGLSCGGHIEVLVARHQDPHGVWPMLRQIVGSRTAGVLLSGVSPNLRDQRMVVTADGRRAGGLGTPHLEERALKEAGHLFEGGGTRNLTLGENRVFAEAFLPAPRLAIVGATPVAEALCHLASCLDFEVMVIDPRPALAQPSRFPEAAAVIPAWPDEALREVGLDPYVSVVALAHDAKLDGPALAAGLRAGCMYVGQIGGARTQRLRRQALAEEGLGAEAERVRGPVGLDLGAETPSEIALSILAELVAIRRGRSPGRAARARESDAS